MGHHATRHRNRLGSFFRRYPAAKYLAVSGVTLLLLGVIFASAFWIIMVRTVGDVDLGAVSDMEEPTKVYDQKGKLLYQFYEKNRDVVPLAQIPKEMQQAIIAIEDRHFYQHSGYELPAMARAALINLSSGHVRQGGSTLTQQLARNTYLTTERSITRKLRELALAARLEATYRKDQILELYLNRIYLGSGYYGVAAAARGYFNKPVSQLRLEEAALLAGLAKAPTYYSPHTNPTRALKRRNQVLDAMAACEFITPARAAAAKQTALDVRPRTQDVKNSNYALEYVKQQLLDRFGYDKIFKGGLQVYTTIDADMQAAAQQAIENHLSKVEAQRGFHHVSRAEYLRQHPPAGADEDPDSDSVDYLQGALVCMSAHTGEVYALVGGRSFQESKFNRAVQAKRQPGSAFKPFVYAAALKSGLTPATLVDASPLEFKTVDGVYRPSNADHAQYGSMTLRAALRKSVNTVAIRLGQQVGIQRIIHTAHDFGINENLPAVVSLPLGPGEVTLLEMVKAYSAFPNQGSLVEPSIIARVLEKDGTVLYEHSPASHRAVDEDTAFLLTTMLTDAVDHGTGYGVRAAGFRLPAGGKTGTTNDSNDAWFFGFTPDVVAGVWVGFDNPRQIIPRGFGATLAVPIWAHFMKQSFGQAPKKEFKAPKGIVRVNICAESGQLATDLCSMFGSVYPEYFTEITAPTEYCAKHSAFYPSPLSEGSALPRPGNYFVAPSRGTVVTIK